MKLLSYETSPQIELAHQSNEYTSLHPLTFLSFFSPFSRLKAPSRRISVMKSEEI